MYISLKAGMIQPNVNLWLERFTVVFKNSTYVIGAFCILGIDIITGPIFLGNLNTAGSVLYTAMFWMISMALTAVQMMLWDYALKHGIKRAEWRSYAPAIAAGVLMLVDTLFDVGFVTQMLFPDTPPRQILPDNIDIIWYGLVLVVGIVSLLCEPLLMWFFRKMGPEKSV